jgi:molybdopterin biosynthesis enzyme MoaB
MKKSDNLQEIQFPTWVSRNISIVSYNTKIVEIHSNSQCVRTTVKRILNKFGIRSFITNNFIRIMDELYI